MIIADDNIRYGAGCQKIPKGRKSFIDHLLRNFIRLLFCHAMRLHLFITTICLLTFLACSKEKSCENCRDNNQPPVAIAGSDQLIQLPLDSVLLDGSASYDPDGTITHWSWKKIAGPGSYSLRNAARAKTVAGLLTAGNYFFELTVEDNGGLSAKDTIGVSVIDPFGNNRPPVADAGQDQIITVPPADSVILDGSASSDPDNDITGYLWTKISGPSSYAINNINGIKTKVTNLAEGVYKFELKVTDAGGLSDKDTVTIEVRYLTAQQILGDIGFYFPDPTGTLPSINVTLDTPVPPLVAITINNLSDTLSGIWDKDHSPTCPFYYDYLIAPGENCVFFSLPPGTYQWNAKSTIIDLSPYPGLSGQVIQYFQTPHNTQGTITVTPGYNCIVQKIVFP